MLKVSLLIAGHRRLKQLNRKFKYGHFKFPETRQDHSSEGD
jgi:hypothetical protein